MSSQRFAIFTYADSKTGNEELDTKQPYHHVHHICTCIADNRAPITMPNAKTVLNGAPFDE